MDCEFQILSTDISWEANDLVEGYLPLDLGAFDVVNAAICDDEYTWLGPVVLVDLPDVVTV